MIFPRNRKVGSFSDIDRGQTRSKNPTSIPRRSEKPSRAGSGTLVPGSAPGNLE